MSFILHLAFPPTLNHANIIDSRNGRPRFFPSPAKVKFIAESDVLFLRQKRGLKRISGRFTYHLILNEDERHGNSDGDNRGKAALDYLQRVDLIDNDKLAEGGSWSWGPCEHGAMLSVYPFPSSSVGES